MAFLDFGKKREVIQDAPPPPRIPTDMVISMRQQGLSNNQIVQNLQRDGYSSSQIFDAMNQADVKASVEGSAVPLEGDVPENPMQGMMDNSSPSNQSQDPRAPPGFSMQDMGNGRVDKQMIEEVTEAIIEEKWNVLVKNLNKIIEWKNATNEKILKMDQAFEDLKRNFEELHKALIGKVGDYDRSLLAVSSDIKAMEKVFSDVLPILTKNVNELSRVTRDIKEGK
ncbi:hypothetical protein HZB02_06085 [Candidatus Woesearchaeota archaeon]|nr:hypothetical protein [Candidatus Woesearchaeota archaeon]